MALNIKDADTDRLVRRYAQLKGTSYTRAIRLAVTDALKRESVVVEGDSFLERVKRVQDIVAAHPIMDHRSADEIISYDEHGLPR